MSIALFIVVNPLGSVPIFMSLTQNMDNSERKRTFRLAIIVGLLLLTLFTLIGQNILLLFGISIDSFMIAGGILLLIVAIRLLIIGGWEEKSAIKESVGAVPIGCPFSRSRRNNYFNSKHSNIKYYTNPAFSFDNIHNCLANLEIYYSNL